VEEERINFKTLVLAGLGTIGSGLLRMGKEMLDTFEQVIVVDRNPEKLCRPPGLNLTQRLGDIEDSDFLITLFKEIRLPALFVNLCSGVDNVRIRKAIAPLDVAYLDSCASGIQGEPEYRFTRLMPYTLQKTSGSYPHWLCWGINPGLVEIMARRMMQKFVASDFPLDVSIYEFDQLHADLKDSQLAVGWSPEALFEEMMISPSFYVADNQQVESGGPGTRKVLAFWKENAVLARLVGHEDVWNIGQLDSVKSAQFFYALNPAVMEALEGKADEALARLKVPAAEIPVFGLERVAVQVKSAASCRQESLVWEVDHQDVWRRHKVNAVQYQTGKSLLLAISLLQWTHYGRRPLNCCAAGLPISPADWDTIEQQMTAMDIRWTDADALALRAAALTGC